ncbi:MAG: hypothetical protein AB1725_11335 [Armatimonadota bacterium]
MKKLLLLLLPLALVPAWAGGFFDDFDGEDLGSHWRFGNPKGTMRYMVHDSLLEVYGFAGFGSREWIYAHIARYTDFDMRAIVGWRAGNAREGLFVMVENDFPVDSPTAFLGFARTPEGNRTTNRIRAGFRDGPQTEIDGPGTGFHEFRLTRSAGVFSAYFDGELILRGGGTSEQPAKLTLLFSGDRQSLPVSLMVDRVSVVPEPASVGFLAVALAALAMGRRRIR